MTPTMTRARKRLTVVTATCVVTRLAAVVVA